LFKQAISSLNWTSSSTVGSSLVFYPIQRTLKICYVMGYHVRRGNHTCAMRISISLGSAIGDSRTSNISNIFKQADNQMYINKSKNRREYMKVFNDRFKKYMLDLFKQ